MTFIKSLLNAAKITDDELVQNYTEILFQQDVTESSLGFLTQELLEKMGIPMIYAAAIAETGLQAFLMVRDCSQFESSSFENTA